MHGNLKASNAAAIAAALWDSADFDGAAHYFSRAVQEQPSDLEALHGYGKLLLARNDLAAAVALLERAHALASSLAGGGRDELSQRVRRDLAWGYYRLHRYDYASELFATLPQQQGFAAQLQALGERNPYATPPDVEEIVLPFLGTDPLPIVTIVVGGKEHAFIVDTGTAQVTLDTAFLRELDLPTLGRTEARLASGQSAPLVYTLLPSLWLGEVELRDVPAEVMDIRRFAPQISGSIGTTLLQQFHVLLDFAEQVLRLRPRRNGPFDAFETMAAAPLLLLDAHLLLTPLRLNNYTTMAYLATGMAGVDFTVPPSTAEQAHLTMGGTMQGVSSGGMDDLSVVVADEIAIGDTLRTNAEGLIGFFPAELEWRYGFRVGALVGRDMLGHHQVGLDFEQMRILFGGA